MNRKYPSAVDLWLAAFLIGTPLGIVAFGAFMLTRSAVAGIITIITGILIGGLMAAFALPCVYTLTDERLEIRCGILEDDVPLTKIRKTEKSSSTWSAPALSSRRVKITLDDGFRLISPKDRDGFIADLTARLGHEKRPIG
jgi:Bacterial PH domain